MSNFFGVSRLMATINFPSSRKRSSVSSLRSSLAGARCDAHSYDHHTFHDRRGAQISVPALHRVLLHVAVPAEQLHAVAADLHAVLGGEAAGQGGLAGEALALLGARRGPQHGQPRAL